MGWKDIRERAALATGNFAKIFADLEVPPLPQMAIRVTQIAQQPDFDIDELSQVIASDTGLTAKILRFVNSSHFGLRHRVTEIERAVVLCGAKRIQSVTMALSVAQVMPQTAAGFNRLAFWQQALQRAVFAQVVAGKIARGTEGEAFTAALLQDMAMPILLSRWERHYLPVVKLAEESGRPLVQVEDEQLTWNHAQAGAWMARNWGFLDVLVCSIGLHHHTVEQLSSLDLLSTPVAATAVSAFLPDVESTLDSCCNQLNISKSTCLEFFSSTDEACNELAQQFSVPIPKPLSAGLAS